MMKRPCLLISNDEANATVLHVMLTEPPMWDALPLKSTLRVLRVDGTPDVDMRQFLLQLFHAIQSHHDHGIASIEYWDCKIVELGHLAYWWLARTKRERPGDNDEDHSAPPMLTLRFERCDIDICAATTLCFMLESGVIADLALCGCTFEDGSAEIIETGLKNNQSLTNFEFVLDDEAHLAIIMNGILCMLHTNQSVATLSLDMNGSCFWDVYHAVEGHTRLKRLQLYNAQMDVANIGTIMKMCQDVKSLKEIAFHSCRFTPSGMRFLVDQLSKNVELDDLVIEDCELIQPVVNTPLELRWRGLQVSNFVLAVSDFCDQFASKFFDELASNSNIQKLSLFHMLDSDDDYRGLCNMIRSQNHCPSVLTVYQVQRHAAIVVESLQYTTKLKELTIGVFGKAGMVLFAKGLCNMSSLRSLCIDGFQNGDSQYSEEFFKSLVDSLEVNTTLWSLSLRGIDSVDAMAKAYLPRIRYLLAINRVGRTSLLTADAPVGVWPRVMARCSTDPDGIFFSLTAKPDMIVVPSRKRTWSEL
jgi:hypothetical protein